MTILPPQAERDSIGIDTYERAILYAASMLRRSFLVDGEKANLKRLSITTAQSRENNNILIEGEFPYSNSLTWERGGDVFKPVWYLSLSDPSNSFSPPSNLLPFGNPYINLPSDPGWVETLEEYFIWVLSQSKAALHLESPPRHDVISYRFFDSRSPDPVVEVKASLPFDLDLWLRDRHFFNALLPLLKYSPAIKAIEVGEFTRQALIKSTDRKVRVIGNPLFPDSTFTRESIFEVSSTYFKIFRNPVVEFTRESIFSSEGARLIPDFSEFVKESIIAVTQHYVGFAEYTRTTVIDVTLDKKNPIIEQSTFTRETVIDVDSNVQGSSTLPTYNSIIPLTVPASSISQDHFNFVVYVKLEDIDFRVDLSSKTEAQQREFYDSIRVKAPVGNELPTYVRGRYQNSNKGYLFFRAPFVSASQDNVFFINFDSNAVTSNPDEKQVFKDYWWVSLAMFTDLGNPLYDDDANWNLNQSPSGLNNSVPLTEDNAIRGTLSTSRELPLDKSVNAEVTQGQNSGIETSSISFGDDPTLTIWTSQGIDSLVTLSNLGFNTRTEIGIVESIDETNNEFTIQFWESKFDDGEIVFFGYFATGNEDGTMVEANTQEPVEGTFTLTRVGTDRFEIGSVTLDLLNDAPYNGTAQVEGLEITEVNTLNNNVVIKDGDTFLSDGQSVSVGLNHSGESDGSVTNDALSSPTTAGMPRMVGYGSALNNQDTNISENFKYTISKVDQNKFKLISVQDATEFNIGTVNSVAYNGISRIAGNPDLQTTLPEIRLFDVNSNEEAMRRYDRTINDAYLDGNGQGSDPLTSVLNGALNARLYNDSVVSYIKLAKYTKSQQRIIDEYNNETNPTNFYQVGTAKEISEFTREAIIESTEEIILPIFETIKQDGAINTWFNLSNTLIDSTSGIELLPDNSYSSVTENKISGIRVSDYTEFTINQQINFISSLNNGGVFSIEIFATPFLGDVFLMLDSSGAEPVLLEDNADTLKFLERGTATGEATTNINSIGGTYSHVVATYERGNFRKIYVNGSLKLDESSGSATNDFSNVKLSIKSVDVFIIATYDRALTPTEINNHYNQGV